MQIKSARHLRNPQKAKIPARILPYSCSEACAQYIEKCDTPSNRRPGLKGTQNIKRIIMQRKKDDRSSVVFARSFESFSFALD